MTPAQITLDLPDTTTFEEWSDLGRQLCRSARTINWLIGDWLIAGSDRYGERARTEALTIFRSDVERFDPIVKTCRRFPTDRRHAALSFGHHLAVMAVPDDTEAENLLAKAEEGRITAAALKAQVRVIRDLQVPMLPDDDPEDTAMRLIAQAWNRAPRAARESFMELAEEANLGVIDL
ncbi:MAG: hypothetical protein PGN16_04285 [Sphingomonas phyllosphaerae]|uniref:hypothetical protein n=1 Tax=Sphingomonas phyllosphaerae TaxID=257003 RepID=UPI002FFB7026